MALLLLPNQLFEEAMELDQDTVYLVEDDRFFHQFDYHVKKLMLHRASMKAFEQRLDNGGFNVRYIEHDESLERAFEEQDRIEMFDPVDHEVANRLGELAAEKEVELETMETPMFMSSMEWNRKYFEENEYYHLEYYKEQRRRFDVLVDAEGDPEGGKWSFDPENRKKLPEEEETPDMPEHGSEYVEKAKEYVERNFPENPGEIDCFFYPVTHENARQNLHNFLVERMGKFGPYQDAIDRDLKFGFHSLLSSSINTGLLTPREVVDTALEHHEERDYPLNSLEGFLRQILGWREYIRALYELEGEEMRSRNFFDNNNSLPEEFYTAETGLPPVDVSIENVLQNAYGHHIERLMVLSNIMLLLEIEPDQVYDWFQELFIDAYDWVMVPNVYGMGQYADPRIMTKPYISSANYIKKMSHYDGGDWEDWWGGLYWRFLDEHREKLEDNHRMAMMLSTLERMNDSTVEEKREKAEEYMGKIGIE